ncbi:MAG: chemotaxis protein CheW [Wenzhouxiangella sp.]
MSEAEIRSVIVPLTGMEMLVPNATVAEVINFTEPQAVSDTPDWMMGTILWRGWQVPLISYAVLAEAVAAESTRNARICVTKSLIGNARMPYFAILAQAFPRLTTITATDMVELASDTKPIAVAGRVVLGEREVVVPDLDRLGHLVAHAAFGSLPVTHRLSTD